MYPLPECDDLHAAHVAMLEAFASVEELEGAKRQMLPGLMAELTATPEWIDAVAKASAAREGFVAAARHYCDLRVRRDSTLDDPAMSTCAAFAARRRPAPRESI